MHAHGRMFMMNIHSLKWKGLIIYICILKRSIYVKFYLMTNYMKSNPAGLTCVLISDAIEEAITNLLTDEIIIKLKLNISCCL